MTIVVGLSGSYQRVQSEHPVGADGSYQSAAEVGEDGLRRKVAIADGVEHGGVGA